MTRFLLDGRPLQDASSVRGIGTYLRGLLGGFEALGASGEVGLLMERGASAPSDVTATGVTVHRSRLRPLNRHLRPTLDPFQVRRALGVDPPALYHAIEYAQPLFPPVPVVVTVHDLIPFVMPGHYSWMRRERALAMRQIRHADAVIAVSRSTAADLERIAGVDPGRVTVIAEGVNPLGELGAAELSELHVRLRLPARFVLAVGTFDPRKRVELVAEVSRRLRADHDVGLVIAGFQGNFAGAVERALHDTGMSDHTRVLGYVTAADLAGLYALTECLLFASAYEGFGLPPLEAMAAGAPVAVFDNSSLREVVGEAGLVVADGDGAAMASAVSALLGDPADRARRGRLGRERAASFTWEGAAAATLRVYAAALRSR